MLFQFRNIEHSKKPFLKHLDCRWGLTMMSLHKACQSVTDFGNAHTAPVPTLQSIQPFLPSISDPAGL